MNFFRNCVLVLSSFIFSTLPAHAVCLDYIDNEWPASRYIVATISEDSVVVDNISGLMWKKCAEGLSGEDCATGILSLFSWEGALQQPTDLNANQGYAGFDDWRLPNVEELRSLAALNCFDPAINLAIFPSTPSLRFWSSSPYAANDLNSWHINFFDGLDGSKTRLDEFPIRLVRNYP